MESAAYLSAMRDKCTLMHPQAAVCFSAKRPFAVSGVMLACTRIGRLSTHRDWAGGSTFGGVLGATI